MALRIISADERATEKSGVKALGFVMERDWIFVTEQWRPVPSFPAYEVSDEGNVRRGGRQLRRHTGKNNYWYVQLWKNGTAKYRTVHSIVAEAFLGPRPKGAHVSHLDSIVTGKQIGRAHV